MMTSATTTQGSEKDGLTRLGAFLAGGFTFLTGAFTVFGIAAGDFERIFRNRSGEAVVALMLIGFGIGSGVVVSNTGHSGREPEAPLGSGSLGMLASGLVLLVGIGLWPNRQEQLALPDIGVERWVLFVIGLVVLIGLVVWFGSRLLGTKFKVAADAVDGESYQMTVALIGLAAFVVVVRTVTTWRAAFMVLGFWLLVAALLRFFWPPSLRPRALLLILGFVAYFVGLGSLFGLAVDNASAKDRPTITAEIEETETGLSLLADVSASGLRNDEHILVTVEGLSRSETFSPVRAGRSLDLTSVARLPGDDSVQTLHLSRTGPDVDGKVDLTIRVPLSPGLYERLRISAFLASPNSVDLLGQLASLNREVQTENRRREEFDATNDVYKITSDDEADDDEATRAQYDLDREESVRTETTRREAFDATIALATVDEEATRAQYELKNQEIFRTETNRREAFDVTNALAIADEKATRAQYDIERKELDQAETTRREEFDQAETTRREEFDAKNYQDNVGTPELEVRAAFDAEERAKRLLLTGDLEAELLQDFRCSAGRQARGCVILLMPELPNRPLLEVEPVMSSDGMSLHVKVDVEILSADDLVLLEVYVRAPLDNEYSETVYTASVPPNEAGELHADLDIPLATSQVGEVCVVAELVRGGRGRSLIFDQPRSTCHVSDDVSAVELSLPRLEATTTMPPTTAPAELSDGT